MQQTIPVFKYALRTGGNLHSAYVFETKEQAEKAAKLLPGRWVSVKKCLPVPNKEVPVLTGGGREAVGWYGDGSWVVLDDSGYDWYKQEVIAWYDVPAPTMEQIANWI